MLLLAVVLPAVAWLSGLLLALFLVTLWHSWMIILNSDALALALHSSIGFMLTRRSGTAGCSTVIYGPVTKVPLVNNV